MRTSKHRWMFMLVITLLACLSAACGIDSLTGADDSDSDSDTSGTGGG